MRRMVNVGLAVVVCCSLIQLVSTRSTKDCDEDCLECPAPTVNVTRDCPPMGFDCNANNLDQFTVSDGKLGEKCDSLKCKDEGATLFVLGKARRDLTCNNKAWEYKKGSDKTTQTALCAKCCDACKTAVPNSEASATKVRVLPVCCDRPCQVAYCSKGKELAGYLLGKYGTQEVIDSTHEVRCSGDGNWVDQTTGSTYMRIFCVPGSGSPENGSKDCSYNEIACKSGYICDDEQVERSGDVLKCAGTGVLFDNKGRDFRRMTCTGGKWSEVNKKDVNVFCGHKCMRHASSCKAIKNAKIVDVNGCPAAECKPEYKMKWCEEERRKGVKKGQCKDGTTQDMQSGVKPTCTKKGWIFGKNDRSYLVFCEMQLA